MMEEAWICLDYVDVSNSDFFFEEINGQKEIMIPDIVEIKNVQSNSVISSNFSSRCWDIATIRSFYY